MYITDLAGIRCAFYQLASDSTWSTWQWKIDSFLTDDASENADVVIKKEDADRNFGDTSKFLLCIREYTGFFHRIVYRMEDGSFLWEYKRTSTGEVILRFQSDAKWSRITLLEDRTQTNGTIAFEYLCHIFPGVMLKHRCLTFHSTLLEYAGEAIAISAPSGTGKTTHSRLWRDYKGALILNGDRMVCKRDSDGWRAYGTPWSGTSGEQIKRSAPLKAFVVLERSERNYVEKLSPMEAFGYLLDQMLYPKWDKELVGIAMDEMNEFLSEIPVYRLHCRPDADSVNALYQAVWEGKL